MTVLGGVELVSPFMSFRPTETLAFLLTGNLKSSTTPSAICYASPASNTLILTVEGGLCAEMTTRSLCRPRCRGKFEGWFEVGGEAVEEEDEGFEVEWGIEAEGELWRITQRKA